MTILARRGVIEALTALRRTPGMKVGAFGAAVGLKRDATTRLRVALEEQGLIEARLSRLQGPIRVLELRLTPAGEAVADLLLQAEPILAAAAARPQGSG